MIRNLGLLAALLMSCAGGPQVICEGTDFRSVVSEDLTVDCPSFEFIARKNREILVASGVMTAQQLTNSRAHTDVRILATPTFSDPLVGSTLLGDTRWLLGIRLGAGASMVVLLHEELHNFQIDQHQIGTGRHLGWDQNGYYGVADFTEWWMAGTDFGRLCGTMLPAQRQGLAAAGWPVERWEASPCP